MSARDKAKAKHYKSTAFHQNFYKRRILHTFDFDNNITGKFNERNTIYIKFNASLLHGNSNKIIFVF